MGSRWADKNLAPSTARALPSGYNRRIGARVPTERALIDWKPIVPRRRLRRKREAQYAVMEDVSMTGARMTAPRDPLVLVGTQVVIAVGSAQGLVEVRRIDDGPDPGRAEYGVQFIQLESDLQVLVEQAVVADRQI